MSAGISTDAFAADTPSAGDYFTYSLGEGKGFDVSILTLNGDKSTGTVCISLIWGFMGETLEIPSAIIKDDVTYTVTALGTDKIDFLDGWAAWSAVQSTKIIIPDTVTEINEIFLNNNQYVTEVQIPESVNYIGGGAFENCPKLKTVKIDHDNKFYITKDGFIISKDGKNLISAVSSKGKVIIPDKITGISNYAFAMNNNITEVNFPASLESIGDYSFNRCEKLTDPIFNKGIKTIGANAFEGCDSIEKISLPDTVTGLGSSAFKACRKLESLEIGKGLKAIPKAAFENSALSYVYIPGSVIALGDYAFASCHSLKEIKLGKGVKEIGIGCFGAPYRIGDGYLPGNKTIEKITLPETLKKINSFAFFGCVNNELNITIPKSVTSIGKNAFTGCVSVNLESENANYKQVGKGIYTVSGKTLKYYYTTAERFAIPAGVKYIDSLACIVAPNLKHLIVPGEVKTLPFVEYPSITTITFLSDTPPEMAFYYDGGDIGLAYVSHRIECVVPKGASEAYEKALYYNDEYRSIYFKIAESK